MQIDHEDSLAAFFNDYFFDIAKRYLGNAKTKRYQNMYEIKGMAKKKSIADDPHFDDWKKRFKIFLYLNDVHKNNCPFCIYEKSYKTNRKRFIKELEYVLGGRDGSHGYLSPPEIEELLSDKTVQKKIITGSAGTLIFVDTRFVHSGSSSSDGSQRMMLGSYFDLK